ncbi:hypothetical protein T02_8619 [Trichinella nativa]|uniref:Uncharacterized protein n=1 Tax=Trichinella nativa TaxID=6335 RepID=A0A0V1LKL4_9BILA|nr:hypothetical protein T02_8619 [Trichinella nativa]
MKFGTSVSRFFMFSSGFRDAVKGNMANVKPQALPSGYAPGQIKICIFPQAMPQAIYSTIFDLRGPRRRLRLRPRANKNLHIPASYAQSILLHNICLQGDMQIFISHQATPRALFQAFFRKLTLGYLLL